MPQPKSRVLTLTLAAVATIGLASAYSFAQAQQDHGQHQHGQSGGGQQQADEGQMPMSQPMMMRGRMMMRMQMHRQNPQAILALKEELKLSDEQAQQLQSIAAEAREKTQQVLNDEQKQSLEKLKDTPNTPMQMHQHMQQMMQRMHGEDAAKQMQQMCPMMKMMQGHGGQMRQKMHGDDNGHMQGQHGQESDAQGGFAGVAHPYMQLQHQLVQDNAEHLQARFDAIRKHAAALAEGSEGALAEKAKAVADAAEVEVESLDEARTALKPVSEAMIELAKQAPHAKTLHVAYCPMAKASWLQDSKQIANPYMGQRMPACGTIKESLAAAGDAGNTNHDAHH